MTPKLYMEKAQRALSSAQLLLNDGDREGACNRAYYAMFDAAHAALLAACINFNPATTKTHSGLIGTFSEQLIKSGQLSVEMGKQLNQVERIRLLADYTGEEVTNDNAHWAVDAAASFVGAIKRKFAL